MNKKCWTIKSALFIFGIFSLDRDIFITAGNPWMGGKFMGPPGHAPYASFSEDQILAVYNVLI